MNLTAVKVAGRNTMVTTDIILTAVLSDLEASAILFDASAFLIPIALSIWARILYICVN